MRADLNQMRYRVTLAVAAVSVLIAATVAAISSAGASPLPSAPACPIFPATNVWNKRVDTLPVASNSQAMIAAIGAGVGVHPDFGSYAGYGIPYNVVSGSQKKVAVKVTPYGSESFKGPWPIPASPRIEAGSDRHMLIVDKTACRLYELWEAKHTAAGWTAGSGATWDLRSNNLRRDGWTSADAAGLPILPGLVRYQEDANGVINHALRFTVSATCDGHIYPARHSAGSGSCDDLPPMGLRVRLKASFDVSQLAPQARPIAIAMQRYGMIVADNGSPWYVSGVSNASFNDDALRTLGLIHGSDFEVVATSTFRNG